MSQFTNAAGFVACRKLGGGDSVQRKYRVSAGSHTFAQGDVVTLGATGRINPILTSAQRPFGVITMVEGITGDGQPRALTFSQPTNGPYLVSGQEGFATVNIDPSQTYIVQIDANVTEAGIGAGGYVRSAVPNSFNGLSGQTLASALTTGTSAHCQILGFAPAELVGSRTSAASPVLLEVKLNRQIGDGILI